MFRKVDLRTVSFDVPPQEVISWAFTFFFIKKYTSIWRKMSYPGFLHSFQVISSVLILICLWIIEGFHPSKHTLLFFSFWNWKKFHIFNCRYFLVTLSQWLLMLSSITGLSSKTVYSSTYHQLCHYLGQSIIIFIRK